MTISCLSLCVSKVIFNKEKIYTNNKMKIDYKGKNYELKWSFRALMIYENIVKKSFNPKTISDVIIFFYSVLCASAKGETIVFDEFMDWIDNNPTSITLFSEWLSGVFTHQDVLSGAEIDEDKAKEVLDEVEEGKN